MSEKEPVTFRFDEETGIARIAFNRPEVLNAIDVPTATAFLGAVRTVTTLPGVRCIIITGEGRAFAAGGDVASFGSDPERSGTVVNAVLDALHPAIVALRTVSAPVIAAVKGVAAGGGFSLALVADLVVAAEDAQFLLAYDKIGTSPDCGGTWFLPRKIGHGKAFELMLHGKTIDARKAEALGIVNEVVPADSLESRVEELARQIARGPTRAYGAYKALIDSAFETPLAQQLEAERAAFISATRTADFREGAAAFLTKRKPVFSGK